MWFSKTIANNETTEKEFLYHLATGTSDKSEIWFDLHYSSETGDNDFPYICMNILCRLLKFYQVFTHIEGDTLKCQNQPKRQCVNGKNFSEVYYNFLKVHKLSDNAVFNGSDEIITLTNGCNKEMLTIFLQNIYNAPYSRYFLIYGFKNHISAPKTFDEQIEILNKDNCDIFIEYAESQDHLGIEVYNGCLNYDFIYEIIHSSCEKYTRTLKVNLIT